MPVRRDRKPKLDLKTFLRRTEGSVATIFAVSIIPVMVAVGVGVDVSRAMTSRSHLQDALDATALALAHLPTNTPQATLDQKAAAWMAANLRDGSMLPPTVTVKLSKGLIELDATGKVPTTVTAIAGYKEMTVAAHSSVKWGIGRAEVVLVLDNTGSMAGEKLKRLKAAAKSLVETLEAQVAAGDKGALRVGVVPFSMTVRLSDSSTDLANYQTTGWMSGVMPKEYGRDLFSDNKGVTLTNVDRFKLFTTLGQPWGGCVEMRPDPYDVQDTPPSDAWPATLFTPYFAPDEPDWRALRKPNGNSYYKSVNDYLDDKVDDEDAQDEDLGNKESRFDRWLYMQGYAAKYDKKVNPDDGKGPNAGCDLQPVLRLTNDMGKVKSVLESMTAVGNTNIPIGLMWGWHLLSPNLPFADGVPYSNTETKKFIVLLTDGDNVNSEEDNPNNSTYSTIGYVWQKRMAPIDENASENARTTHMDKRMEKLCDNIKDGDKITIYAVRIDMSGKAPKALSGCATSDDMFYNIDSTGLTEAFQEIAGSISELRIAK
jgi:Flp pilus assembly protein TadG